MSLPLRPLSLPLVSVYSVVFLRLPLLGKMERLCADRIQRRGWAMSTPSPQYPQNRRIGFQIKQRGHGRRGFRASGIPVVLSSTWC